MISEFVVGELYSNEEIFNTLKVANAGGIRFSIQDNFVVRGVIMTSSQDFHLSGENPYQDRLEGEILTYTAAGKVGEQTLGGINNRIIDQKDYLFPIHGFALIASRRNKAVGPKRWQYLGLVEYLRHYPDTQLDSDGKIRQVWLFEFRIHQNIKTIPILLDSNISREILKDSRKYYIDDSDNEIISRVNEEAINFKEIEKIRAKLLVMEPRQFELFLKDLLIRTGFTEVCVTKYTADGGIDVNVKVGNRMWIFEHSFVQIQAKRWLHSVGRKEVAELRGSLQPFARGAVVTTSHFSKAAIQEATEEGKNPIALIDGFRLSKVIIEKQFPIDSNKF
ncbi:MAG: restriction endonuclease [Candidatus Omnitrophica bacterium]|nr:restriction endonuclease [Candidatus Omnitrophota bacterium]